MSNCRLRLRAMPMRKLAERKKERQLATQKSTMPKERPAPMY